MKQFSNMFSVASGHVEAALTNTRVTVSNQDRDLRYTSILNPVDGYGDQVIGKNMSEVYGEEQAQKLEAMRRSVLGDGVTRHELIQVILDEYDRPQFFDSTVHAIYDDEHTIVGITTVSINLTDIIEAKNMLAEANKRLVKVLETTL